MNDLAEVAVRRSRRTERSLPDFSALQDTQRVLEVVRKSDLRLPGEQWDRCVLESVRNRTYEEPTKRAKSSTLITYRLSGPSDLATASAQVFLRAFIEPRPDRYPNGSVVIPDLQGYAWRFPDDPHIPALSTIVPVDSESTVDVLRYKPADRCTLRIQRTDGSTVQNALVAKVFSSIERATAVFERAQHMWHESSRSAGALKVPEPVRLDRSKATVWMTELAGTSPRRAGIYEDQPTLIARALAAVHRSADGDLPVRTYPEQIAEMSAKVQNLATVVPSNASALANLMQIQRDSTPSTARTCPTHGAFRLRQLLLSDRDVGLVDFDSMALGDPLEDVADMVLDLDPFFNVGAATNSALAEAFLHAYESYVGALDESVLAWHLPAQLIKRAHWLRTSAQANSTVHAELVARIDRAVVMAGVGR